MNVVTYCCSLFLVPLLVKENYYLVQLDIAYNVWTIFGEKVRHRPCSSLSPCEAHCYNQAEQISDFITKRHTFCCHERVLPLQFPLQFTSIVSSNRSHRLSTSSFLKTIVLTYPFNMTNPAFAPGGLLTFLALVILTLITD